MTKRIINTGPSDSGWGYAQAVGACVRYSGLALIYPELIYNDAQHFQEGTAWHILMVHTAIQQASPANPILVDGERITDPTQFEEPITAVKSVYPDAPWLPDILRLYKDYKQRYDNVDWNIRVIALEKVLSMDIPAPEGSYRTFKIGQRVGAELVTAYRYTKRVDAIWLVNGLMWYVDHKAYSSLDEERVRSLKMDGGFHGQSALGLKFHGVNFGGVIANLARKYNYRNKHPMFVREYVAVANTTDNQLSNAAPFMQSYVYHLREQGNLARRFPNPYDWPGVYSGGSAPCKGCPFLAGCIAASK